MKQREIKFRGYATGIGWVYGSLVNNLWTYSEFSQYKKGNACCEIITGKYEGDCWQDIAQQEGEAIVSVVPDSVGEFTGLKDKNGNDIYEGDIVMCLTELKENAFIDFIKYDESFCGFTSNKHGSHIMRKSDELFWLEVIGNIYENAELIK